MKDNKKDHTLTLQRISKLLNRLLKMAWTIKVIIMSI